MLTYAIPMLSIPLIQSLNYPHSYTQSDNSINVRSASYEAAPYIKEVVVPRKNSNGNTQSG